MTMYDARMVGALTLALQGGRSLALPARTRASRLDVREGAAFFARARAVIDAGRLREEASFCQHGTTSTLLHSVAVAYCAVAIARSRGDDACVDEVCRAGLLHDYYLYDWHDAAPEHRGHATRHPARALANAVADYPDLTERERDAIASHMFPLTRAPRTRVGWYVTVADKLCAAYETRVRGSRVAYPRLRALCGRHLPGVRLDAPAEA